jgi:ABC-type branched-subunit amino acid transport system ATPase component
MTGAPVLEAESLVAGYQTDRDIVRGVSFALTPGQLVAVVGPNGAGKSTLIKCLCGLLRARAGRVRLAGEDITSARPHQIVRKGVGYVPQRDNVFPRLTVEENLEIGVSDDHATGLRERREEAFELFPALTRRRRQPAGILSGGERQMLAIARALIRKPTVLLLDEPSAGVDPKTLLVLWEKITEIHARGVATVLVEQNARQALAMADIGYVLDGGQVRYSGAGSELLADPRIAELYLGG